MATKTLRSVSVLAAFALSSFLPGAATAQTIPTAFEVGLDLDAGCATTPNGQLISETACIQAIARAVGVAEQYFDLGGDPATTVPPQLDIGYYLCQLAIRVPDVVDAVAEAIEAAFNINLRTGCQQAIDGVDPPPPTPISRN